MTRYSLISCSIAVFVFLLSFPSQAIDAVPDEGDGDEVVVFVDEPVKDEDLPDSEDGAKVICQPVRSAGDKLEAPRFFRARPLKRIRNLFRR